MSWSLSGAGKPAALKAKLQPQFEQAKKNVAHVEHEVKAVELAEQLVNGELDFLAAHATPTAVTVTAGGSASNGNDTYPRSSQVNVSVQPIYGFVE
jgi:hypothetical protein